MVPSVLVNRAPRIAFEHHVWVGDVSGDRPLRRVSAINLSRGGMFIRTDDSFRPGEKLLVAIERPNEILPLAEAVVAWQRPANGSLSDAEPAGVGVSFRRITPLGQGELNVLLKDEPKLQAVSTIRPLSAEPKTPMVFTPPVQVPVEKFASKKKEVKPTEVVQTDLHLTGLPSVRVAATEQMMRLDFSPRHVEGIREDGNTLFVLFRDP